MKTKYCLVLGGGGTKGAYEMGVWKALKELNVEIEAVIGTSIGAVNALWIAQNDFEAAQEIWNTLTMDKVLSLPPGYQAPESPWKTGTLATFHLVGQILQERGQLNTNPLRAMVAGTIDLEKLNKSKIDLGLVTFNLSTLKPEEVFREDVPPDSWTDYIMASSSFPGFVPAKIKDKVYLDGGVWDNIPYDLARKRGYKNFIVVDVSGIGNNRAIKTEGTQTIYIKNSVEMGHVLDFDPEFLQRFQYLGYLDTLRIFGKLQGRRFFFKGRTRVWDQWNRILEKEEFFATIKGFLPEELKSLPPMVAIRSLLPPEQKWDQNPSMILLESAALAMNLDPIGIHTPESLRQTVIVHYNALMKKVKKVDVAPYRHFFTALLEEIKVHRFQDLLEQNCPLELDLLLGRINFQNRHPKILKALYSFFPTLLPGKVFIFLFLFWRKKGFGFHFPGRKPLALLSPEE